MGWGQNALKVPSYPMTARASGHTKTSPEAKHVKKKSLLIFLVFCLGALPLIGPGQRSRPPPAADRGRRSWGRRLNFQGPYQGPPKTQATATRTCPDLFLGYGVPRGGREGKIEIPRPPPLGLRSRSPAAERQEDAKRRNSRLRAASSLKQDFAPAPFAQSQLFFISARRCIRWSSKGTSAMA